LLLVGMYVRVNGKPLFRSVFLTLNHISTDCTKYLSTCRPRGRRLFSARRAHDLPWPYTTTPKTGITTHWPTPTTPRTYAQNDYTRSSLDRAVCVRVCVCVYVCVLSLSLSQGVCFFFHSHNTAETSHAYTNT
jgi:hypothetical protein